MISIFFIFYRICLRFLSIGSLYFGFILLLSVLVAAAAAAIVVDAVVVVSDLVCLDAAFSCFCTSLRCFSERYPQVVLQVSVAVLLDNFVAASTRLEEEVKAERIKVILNAESETVSENE